MSPTTYRHIAVIRGGVNDTYDVSMRTGSHVLQVLRDLDYSTYDIVITRSGEWLHSGIVRSPEHILSHMDVAFLTLRGSYGEDGTVQRMLSRIGIPYTGSIAYPSAIALNKGLAKDHLREQGIKTAPHMRLDRSSVNNIRLTAESLSSLFGPQYVVKPLQGGLSIGTYFANTTSELAQALESSFQDNESVLVEKRLYGKEVTVGILEGYRDQELYVLPVTEIIPPMHEVFYSHAVKYGGEATIVCPANLSYEDKQEMSHIATTAHKALGLRHYSRTDMIATKDGIYFLETNTLPDLSSDSLLQQSFSAVGGSYPELVHHVLERAEVR